jgi:hypothetical protein
MVKVVVRKLKLGSGKRRGNTLERTSVRDSKGKISQFFTIDVKSPTFESDLAFVYKRNVAKARSENKKLFGSPDGVKRLRVAK